MLGAVRTYAKVSQNYLDIRLLVIRYYIEYIESKELLEVLPRMMDMSENQARLNEKALSVLSQDGGSLVKAKL
jgi:hypothetical protein